MFIIEVHDEQLARRLQALAEREQRPVEAVLKTLVDRYEPLPENALTPEQQATVKHIRRKAYAKARAYWQSVGDTAKAALTDDELDEQFAVFDAEGIPRLKSEMTTLEPPVGSLAYAAKMAREADLHLGTAVDASHADDILNEEFADYLIKRMQGDDAAE